MSFIHSVEIFPLEARCKEYCFRTFVQGKRSVRIVNHVYKKFGMQEHLSSGAFVPCHPGIVRTACTRMKRGRRCFASSALSQLLSCAPRSKHISDVPQTTWRRSASCWDGLKGVSCTLITGMSESFLWDHFLHLSEIKFAGHRSVCLHTRLAQCYESHQMRHSSFVSHQWTLVISQFQIHNAAAQGTVKTELWVAQGGSAQDRFGWQPLFWSERANVRPPLYGLSKRLFFVFSWTANRRKSWIFKSTDVCPIIHQYTYIRILTCGSCHIATQLFSIVSRAGACPHLAGLDLILQVTSLALLDREG